MSTFTHLVAGVVGGIMVLFSADLVEKRLGFKLTPTVAIPASVEQRLAAVEKAASAKPAIDVAALSRDLEAVRSRLAELAPLKGQVKTLSEAQAKLVKLAKFQQAASQSSGQTGTQTGATKQPADAQDSLKHRLAKLEQTFETLSRATGPDGTKNTLARLASISGKLSDFEQTLNNQLEALRKSVMAELETRVAKTADASAAAQAGTQRIDRELATIKTNAARLAQRAETLKATDTRLSELVRVIQQQAARLEAELVGLKGDVVSQFKAVARPNDVKAALAPVNTEVQTLASQLKKVLLGEEVRKINAQRIVLALEMGNLKRVLNRGGPFASELAAVKKVSAGKIDLSSLERFKSSGVPTTRELATEFRKLAFKVINAEQVKTDGTVLERLMSGAKSIVRVRRTSFARDDKSTEAIVSRVEKLLKQGNLSGAIEQSKKLPEKARKPAAAWFERLAARADVDRAIAQLEGQLKASLGGGADQPTKTGTKG